MAIHGDGDPNHMMVVNILRLFFLLKQFCLTCRFLLEASLARIAGHAGNIRHMTTQANSESLLLTFYDVRLPPVQSDVSTHNASPHLPSVNLLNKYSPWIQTRYLPVNVQGDGNCFLRALSYSLFHTEEHHTLLRLLSVIEVLRNRSLYDSNHVDYYAPYKADSWLILPSYADFVSSLAKLNSYCDMLAVGYLPRVQ